MDTSYHPDAMEIDEGRGRVWNYLECIVVERTLHSLLQRADQEILFNQIAIIAPYRKQCEEIESYIRSTPRFRSRTGRQLWQNLNIHISTVDSMQGSERDIVIVSLTRANRYQDVGFSINPKRLNVSVSRARKLNIIICNRNTFESRSEHLTYIFNACRARRHGSELVNIREKCANEDPGEVRFMYCEARADMHDSMGGNFVMTDKTIFDISTLY